MIAWKNLISGQTLLRASRFSTPLTSSCNVGTREISSAIDLSGIYPPIPTPFDKNENIDWKSLGFNLKKWDKIPFKGWLVLALLII